MKYLKRFNEKMSPEVYYSAANKLATDSKTAGKHNSRVLNLKRHALGYSKIDKIDYEFNFHRYENSTIKPISYIDTVKAKLNGIYIESDIFLDNMNSEDFSLCINCNFDIIGDTEEDNIQLVFVLPISKNSKIEIGDLYVESWNDWAFIFSDRKSAVMFKKLFDNVFLDLNKLKTDYNGEFLSMRELIYRLLEEAANAEDVKLEWDDNDYFKILDKLKLDINSLYTTDKPNKLKQNWYSPGNPAAPF